MEKGCLGGLSVITPPNTALEPTPLCGEQDRIDFETGFRLDLGEMKQLMLRHAFGFVGRVIFLVSPENIRSQRAVEKIGAVRVGARPDAGGRDSYPNHCCNFRPVG